MRRLLAVALLLLVPGSAQEALRYRAIALPTAVAHVVEVPPSFRVRPVLGATRRTVRAIARETGALAALNGGYFNHRDGVSASYLIRDGRLRADPHRNALLVHNPELAPYLARIFARTEFRVLERSRGPRWAIASHAEPVPAGEHLVDALQAGPRLLPELGLVAEGFVAFGAPDAKGRRPVVRDGIAAYRRAARSALGLREDGTLLLVAVLGEGLSVPELRDLMAAEGCVSAMNLDGGSSTSLVRRVGSTLNAAAPPGGEAKVRSALVVLPRR